MATVPITGSVLEWALRDAGLTRDAFASNLGTTVEVISGWIDEDRHPKVGELDSIATLLHRPRSFFFLPNPPARQPVQAQFRTYENSPNEPGPETLRGIQLAQRIQQTTTWVRGRLEQNDPIKIPGRPTKATNEAHAAALRNWLQWSTDFQMGPESESVVTKAFRSAMQARGLVVLHLTLDEGSTRGFSLWHEVSPLLAINTREGYRARLFSYAHELAHLSLGRTAVCSVRRADHGTERQCNQVAAALLMPRYEFEAQVRQRVGDRKVASLDEVVTLRNKFKVSLRAAAIRAEALGLAASGLYNAVDNAAEYKKRGGSYIPGNERTRPVRRVDQYGHEFVTLLVRAEDAQLLRRRQVADLLRVSDQELGQLRTLAVTGSDE